MADKTTKSNQITPSNKALSGEYTALLNELKSILGTGLNKAYKAVDNIKVQTYWQIGERIVREELQHKNRAEYGKYLVEKLAVDLAISKRNLHEIIQFYSAYPIMGEYQNLWGATPVAKISAIMTTPRPTFKKRYAHPYC